MKQIRKPRHSGFIDTHDDIRHGVASLRRRCKVMRAMHDKVGDPPLRRSPAGFEGLARVIVAQQLSAASATAIWNRVSRTRTPLTPQALLALADEDLRAAGLSRPKIRTLRALAATIDSGALDLDALANADPHTVREALVVVSGIGPWTADIYLMFCVGRADSFAPGDLALQIAVQHAFDLDQRPKSSELEAIATRWRPWRGVAARLLWAYYPTIRNGRNGAAQ